MATTRKASTSKSTTTKRSAATGTADATQLLTNDHREVKVLFNEYKKLAEGDGPEDERAALADKICRLLTIHATLEEEIFYPAAREAEVESDLLDEAEVEHASAKELIAQIETMQPDDRLYDARVSVLGEYIDHHVKEEEGEMFPKCRKADMDLVGLAEQLNERKDELMQEMGLAEAE